MAARYVQIARHDAESYDLFLIPDNEVIVRRFNVLVPVALGREATAAVALNLVTYVRLHVRPEPEVYFDRTAFTMMLRRLETQDAYQRRARVLRDGLDGPVGRPGHPGPAGLPGDAYDRNRHTMARDAEARALLLLERIDPVLAARMQQSQAFYFCTTAHVYIWYPRDRAIVSLDEDAPHYVCIHSRDNTVESNRYDWALTMRTYLLGAESTWRSRANFHNEYRLRGGRDAFADVVREP